MKFLTFPYVPVPILVFLSDNEFTTDISKNFSKKKWIDVTLEDWITIASVPVISMHMTPTDFKYYLPSILVASFENPNYLDWGLKALLPGNAKYLPKGAWWNEYFTSFNAEQKLEIRRYLDEAEKYIDDCSEEQYLHELCCQIWCA